ncbi:MAG: tryptophan--tRNA ligase [Deltaproteobacteria bacterium]
MGKKRIVSGMRTTGALQLGNYFGALENWVKLQDEYDCYFFTADWHALTTGYEDTSQIRENERSMIIDWLSAGLDPEKCVIFRQSDVKEHAELHLLLSMITPLSWLERCPTYKDQIKQLKDKDISTYGFLGYPCLMTADIIVYKSELVPVGEDQVPHVELTREIVRRFNNIYGEIFPEPQPMLTKAKVLPGTDGRKMSKSYGNTILLSETAEDVKKKVNSMVTDPQRIKKDDPGHPDVCAIFAYKKIFSPEEVAQVESDCKQGKIGCVQCKKALIEKLNDYLEPMRQRRAEILKKPDIVDEILAHGAQRARKIAQETMEEVRRAMKL